MAALQAPENEHNTYRLWTPEGKHHIKAVVASIG